MVKSKVINKNCIIEIEENKLLTYLHDIINVNQEFKQIFELYKQNQLIINDSIIINFFVSFLGYTIIHDETVFFQNESLNSQVNKIEYVKNGYTLEKLSKMVYENGKIKKYINPVDREIEKIGFDHSTSPENELSFWYPKTNNIGFKTPKTIITQFKENEVNLIKSFKWNELNEDKILNDIIKTNSSLNLNEEMFIRLGISSNKFNFDSCHINNINELYKKLMIIFDNMIFALEWQKNIELVLREYIKTTYKRDTIYNGMPLNTEFRVFYDFDKKELLGIFNYWEKDTMLDNLTNRDDLLTFANSYNELIDHYNSLVSYLEEEAKLKLPNANLSGKWSVDFLYNGKDFLLIDMAHAECSYYYNKVLIKNK